MNNYDYARKILKEYHKNVMETLEAAKAVAKLDVMSGCEILNAIMVEVEQDYIHSESVVNKAEHDELEDMIQQFYGQVMTACGKDGE